MGYDRKLDGRRGDGSKGHVLVVDDAAFAAKHLTKMLEEAEFKVIGVAENGEDAIKMYKEKSPDIDLVTLDVTMPKLDGIATLEQLLALDSDARVVMVTASGSENTVKKALMLGAKNYIKKPLQYNDVVTHIEQAVRK